MKTIKLTRTTSGYEFNGFRVTDMNPAYRSTHPAARVMGLRWKLEVPGRAAPIMCGTLEDVRWEITRLTK